MGSNPGTSSLLESLPARPPTPPREATSNGSDHHLKQALGCLPVCLPIDIRGSLHTPPSIYSPSDSTKTSSSRRKKVEFSAQAEYKEPQVFGDTVPPRQNPTPLSIPPPSSSRPVKSILKVSYGPNPLEPSTGTNLNGDSASQINIVAMLDSTIQQLAGSDRLSKLDAYSTLVKALKASNNLPDRFALEDKMSLFEQFIQRDTTSKTEKGTIDATLTNHALNLLSTFLHMKIASALSNDFGIFVMDHCIRSFEEDGIPKEVIKHFMMVAAFQSFKPKVMTSDRVGRLIVALRKIEGHTTGKSIIVSRILIYRKLLKQCPQLMISHSDWLFDLFTDMLSSLKEIRITAISLGLEAAFLMSGEKHLSRKITEIFQSTSEDDLSYIKWYAEKLQSLTKHREHSIYVPQIWSVVILFIRSPEKWESWITWLKIIQDCFNSTDFPTKQEANLAWNRLAYCLHLEDNSLSKMMPILSQPLASQLRRRGTAKQIEDFRKVVLGSVCNLFYYAFHPHANLSHLDSYWDQGVKPLMQQLTDRRPEEAKYGLNHASTILTGLFDCTTKRLWSKDHIVESPLVKPEELPAIDAKWIRRNASRIFNVVGPILEKAFLDLSQPRSSTHKLWHTLIGAASSAASKEVKVSIDTATFVGHVLSVLVKIWAKGVEPAGEAGNTASAQFLSSMREFILTMVESLGLLPFTEKFLCRDKQNQFIPPSTPSNRLGKGQISTQAPLHHLFSILSALPPGIPDDDEFTDFFRSIFAPFFSVKSEKGKMELAQELLKLIPMDALCPYGPWVVASEWISLSLDASQSSHRTNGSSIDAHTGQEYRDVVRVLERGLKSVPNLPWEHWHNLFSALSIRLRDETGDAGVAICAIEPLARLMIETSEPGRSLSTSGLKATVELLAAARQPRDQQALDAARRRLWGTAIAGPRSSSIDPFDNLYKLISGSLELLYETIEQRDPEETAATLIKELVDFIGRGNTQLFVKTLAGLQSGISCWIQDEKAVLNSRQSSAIVESTKMLWDTICSRLETLDQPEDLPLDTLEPLICAAFESKHRHIVNSVSKMWNRIFEHVEEIPYPETLKKILVSRRSFVDLVLPGLEFSSIESGAQQPAFIDSQEDMDVLNTSSTKSDHRFLTRPSSSGHSHSHSPHQVKLVMPEKHLSEPTPSKKASKKASKRTPRLRHDDSQIQFAPISSSPGLDVAEESQLLTERQKEVRERQRESSALFPEIRSSSPAKMQASPRLSSPSLLHDKLPDLPEPRRAITPDVEGDFEDYITSTPTPRRGQAVPIATNDHDMVDPPSSPPEPRHNPLLLEIKSRSNSNSILDEWHFSSSPISGSPTAGHGTAPEQSAVGALNEDFESAAEPIIPSTDEPLEPLEQTDHVMSDADIVEDSAVFDAVITEAPQTSGQGTTSDKPDQAIPATPTRNLRPRAAQETPRSDNNDVFVDALTSPAPPTPTRQLRIRPSNQKATTNTSSSKQPNDRSFVVSDIDETSMLRVVAELEAKSLPSQLKNKVQGDSPVASPAASPVKEGSPILDCITVSSSPMKGRSKRSRKTKSSSPIIASTPVEAEDADSSQETAYSLRRRRKRSLSHVEEPAEPRKSKRRSPELEENDSVPDSQVVQPAPKVVTESDTQASDVAPKKMDNGLQEITEENSNELVQSSQFLSDGMVRDAGEDVELPSVAANEQMELDAGDDYGVDSQITEEHEAQRQKAHSGSLDMLTTDEAVTSIDDSKSTGESATESAALGAETENLSTEPAKTKAEEIMAMLRESLEALRSTALSRGEVHQVEDMCMDIKRELYDAERRGRK